MLVALLLVLAIIPACLGDANLYPIYIGCDTTPIFDVPIHVVSVMNCNGMAINVSYAAYGAEGGLITSGVAPFLSGESYSSAGGWALIVVTSSTSHTYPYTVYLYNAVPGVTQSTTIPCYSTVGTTCNPYGYGRYYTHTVITLPSACVYIYPSLFSNGLEAPTTLTSPNYLQSANGVYNLVMQNDGNLVAYSPPGKYYWDSGTQNLGTPPYRLVMQSDSNLVIYDSTGAYTWHINWGGGSLSPYYLTVQNSGLIATYTNAGTEYWSA